MPLLSTDSSALSIYDFSMANANTSNYNTGSKIDNNIDADLNTQAGEEQLQNEADFKK
ncbi:hypothetical protein H0H87_008164, partial [Tephrocybe sp. NHM501043]